MISQLCRRLHRGEVEVQVAENGHARTVARLGEGDFFGEMALFTGAPRAANVVAAEETEVLEIGHPALQHLFKTNPRLVEALSHTIAERHAGLKNSEKFAEEDEPEPEGLISSIKRFFRLD